MFKKNKKHEQLDFFGYDVSSSSNVLRMVEKTEEYAFYKLVFCHIEETDFACLYCTDNGRPNSPVNAMVSALILKEKKNLSYHELFKQLHFNLALRVAIGIFDLDRLPFNEATLFNFQNRLKSYYNETGENLFDHAFTHLTRSQLQKLQLKTSIARTDSFLINSNIRNYGRLQLLLEVLVRLYRVLSKSDQEQYDSFFKAYTNQSSEHYVYGLKGEDLPHEFEKVGTVYYWLHTHLSDRYAEKKEYRIFQRVLQDHFRIDETERLQLIPSDEISSSSLQSPDDEDATYRFKNGKQHHGFSGNLLETCHPDNPVNIIVDVSTHQNNMDDSVILQERFATVTEQLPDLEEIHFDGAYGSKENDITFEKAGIVPIQTAVRGRSSEVEMNIEKVEEEEFQVTCPFGQTVSSQPTRTRYKAVFDKSICSDCPYQNKCPALCQKHGRVFYFDAELYLRKKRHLNYLKLPPERRTLRSNVEATVSEFIRKTNDHQLKVRGIFKAHLFLVSAAIGINFGRIYRYLSATLPEKWYRFIFFRLKPIFRSKSNDLRVFFSYFFINFENLLYTRSYFSITEKWGF